MQEEFSELCHWVFTVSSIVFCKLQIRGRYGRSTVIVARKEGPGGQKYDRVGVRQE